MTLQFYQVENNGGSEITKYNLYMNDGNDINDPTTLVTAYADNSMTFILVDTAHAMTAGKVYKFKYTAVNERGNSLDSDTVRFSLCDMPLAPAVPTKDKTQSSLSSIYLTWNAVADTQLPGGSVTGYKLYMKKITDASFTLVYNGENRKTVRTFLA
jgi:hypothetical protein